MRISSLSTCMRISSPSTRSRGHVSAAAGLMLAVALTACYAAELPVGSPCKDSTFCPEGQACIAGACAITRGAPVDGSIGPGVDAAPGAPTGDAGSPTSCTSSDACTTATMLGAVSGDTSSSALTAQGYRAAWFRIRVTEDDVTLEGSPLRLLATLTLPAGGTDFDLVVHVNPSQDVVECAAAFGTSSASGNTRQVRAAWGSNKFDDTSDDSRDVVIEIRPRSATCDPAAHWQLSLAGDTN